MRLLKCSDKLSSLMGFVACLLGLSNFGILPAQTILSNSKPGAPIRLLYSDQAILESREARRDIPCEVSLVEPVLGFDMRFHSGYEVKIPLKALSGNGDNLTIIFRVTPAYPKGEPVYFTQHLRVPPIGENAGGDAYLQGAFDVGEGRYEVDWLMRNRLEEFCSDSWDFQVALTPEDRKLSVGLPPWTVGELQEDPFRYEPPAEKAAEPGLDVKLLVNLAPLHATSTVLQPADTAALVSTLRAVTREPHIRQVSLVAFNLREFRVVYRQENAGQIDFPAFGEALQSLNPGTVDVKMLSLKHPETDFLGELIRQETTAKSPPDALIFLGPKVMLDENVSRETLRELGNLQYPIFYINYNPSPRSHPWRDAIGNVVKFLKGYEYTVTRPKDLLAAVSEMVSHIVTFKSQRAEGSPQSSVAR